jgi:hypothetical protein
MNKKVRAVESLIYNVHEKIVFMSGFLGAAGSLIKYEDFAKEKEVEEVKMLTDNIKEPLLDPYKYSLHELINILQSFANDPSFNIHQTGFGSYIANHVIKEKIQRYNNDS